MTKAWMLRQDGEAFEVEVHLYVMDTYDFDFSTESDVAQFLLKTKSKDSDLAESVICAWMTSLVEDVVSFEDTLDDIKDKIRQEISGLPYKFSYPMDVESMLSLLDKHNTYYDIDTFYEYLDNIDGQALSKQIKDSLNQQFCRVRFGGRLNDEGQSGVGALWFRVSSIGYNWANTIYVFASSIYRKLQATRIFICRDYESDNGDDYTKGDYFYKAKDGTPYFNMPIDEYFREDHEHSPVFSAKSACLGRGVISSIRDLFYQGHTKLEICAALASRGFNISDSSVCWTSLFNKELKQCIDCSYFDNVGTRTKIKANKIKDSIMKRLSFIDDIELDLESRENTQRNPVGFLLSLKLKSEIESIDGITVEVVFNKPFNTIPVERIVSMFFREYRDYCNFSGIQI